MDIFENVPILQSASTATSVSTSDGGLFYAGVHHIAYIAAPPSSDQVPPMIKTFYSRMAIIGLDVSPRWGKPSIGNSKRIDKQFAIVCEDGSVQVWDSMLGEAIMGHKAHQQTREDHEIDVNGSRNSALLSYMCNGNIFSMDTKNFVIYCVASNSYGKLPSFIPPRNHKIDVLRCSPYNDNMFAVGTNQGTVLICDLRKMIITYKFHGHNARITDLAWRKITSSSDCDSIQEDLTDIRTKSVATNDPTTTASKAVQEATVKELAIQAKSDDDDIFDVYNFDHLDGEFGAPAKVKARQTSKSSDDCADFVGIEKTPSGSQSIDYMEACESIKADIIAKQQDTVDTAFIKVEVTLADCKNAQDANKQNIQSDSLCSSDSLKHDLSATKVSDSTEGSLELIQYSSSSDDAVIVDGDAPKPKREVLHHIYHQAEVHATENEKASPQLNNKLANTAAESIQSLKSECSLVYDNVYVTSIDARDVFMIWDTNTGGNIGKNSYKFVSGGRNNSNFGDKNKVDWLNDSTIVTKTQNKMSFWSLEPDSKLKRFKIQKQDQYKCLKKNILSFSISPTTQNIWNCVKNFGIELVDPMTGRINGSYGWVAYGLHAIAECPDDMNKIALGCSDKRVAIFDISKLSPRCIPIESTYVSSPVYTLAWSPDSTQLAYGCVDGLVGILNADNMSVVTSFRSATRREVYCLVWQENYIYFIAGRGLNIYNVKSRKIATMTLTNTQNPSYISLRDKFLFVGTHDGFLQLYERKDQELSYAFWHQSDLMTRYITDIAWNPLIHNQFAAVGHEKFVFILEFHDEEHNWKLLHTFTANENKASIASIKWSNQNSNLFLTFHIEGLVCLWNTNEPQQVPLTLKYNCPMWCGIFLPSDENIIMCSGKTTSLEFVNIQNTFKENNRIMCSKADYLKNVKWASKSLTQPHVIASVAKTNRERRNLKDNLKKMQSHNSNSCEVFTEKKVNVEMSMVSANDAKNEKTMENMMNNLSLKKDDVPMEGNKCKETLPNSFLAHSRTSLYLSQKELNKSPLEKLAIVLTENAANIEKSVLVAKLFSTKAVAKELLSIELKNVKHSNDQGIAPFWLTLANFELKDELEHHLKNKTLTEFHISLAPAISGIFWTKLCKGYALQLEEQGYILHAATYLMCIHASIEAVQLLLKHELYKEALLLARIYLPATDPLIKKIINTWIEQLEKTGNLSAAALICVLDNDMLRGYMFLRRLHNRTDEIASLMEEIKRIGQLKPPLEICNTATLTSNQTE